MSRRRLAELIDAEHSLSDNGGMNRILLVYEDYVELMNVEATLKKVGFDVIGLSSEYAVSEQMLSFNPDVVVGFGRGNKVSSLGVGKRLKEMARWSGKSVLIFPTDFKPTPQELIKIRVDMILEAPVAPLRVLQVLAKLLGHDEAILLERLNKSSHAESPQKGDVTSIAGEAKTEAEAIYIKGATERAAEETSDETSKEGRFSLNSNQEEPQEGTQGFALNTENKKESMRFKFNEPAPTEERAETQAFPDVNLKDLERELLGESATEVERIDAVDNLPTQASSSESSELSEPRPALIELKKAQDKLNEKIKRYSALVKDIKVSPKSTVTRVEARSRHKKLIADLNSENSDMGSAKKISEKDGEKVHELDKLRRDFTKALFKK